MTIEDIEKYKANCWLISPPCQPYTRGGKSLDDKDQRAKGLLNLIDILPKLTDPPKYVFLENVLNFEAGYILFFSLQEDLSRFKRLS